MKGTPSDSIRKINLSQPTLRLSQKHLNMHRFEGRFYIGSAQSPSSRVKKTGDSGFLMVSSAVMSRSTTVHTLSKGQILVLSSSTRDYVAVARNGRFIRRAKSCAYDTY